MKKNAYILLMLSLFASITGLILRKIEVLTLFNPYTGVASTSTPISLVLIALSIGFIVVVCLFTLSFKRDGFQKSDYIHSFLIKTRVELVVIEILAMVLLLCSIYSILSYSRDGIVLNSIYSILGVAASIAIILTTWNSFMMNDKRIKGLSVIPVLFTCYWLVITYKNNNSNPDLLDYGYKCLAIAFTTLSFYYAAGHAYGKFTPFRTITTHFIGSYFCFVTALDFSSYAQFGTFCMLAVYQLVRVCEYMSSVIINKKFGNVDADEDDSVIVNLDNLDE